MSVLIRSMIQNFCRHFYQRSAAFAEICAVGVLFFLCFVLFIRC